MKQVFQAGFGARLKAAREAKSMQLTDVAAKLKLNLRQIEAMEAEDMSHLPGEVFARGFVRNYARLVDLEPDSLIAPVEVQAVVSETITAPNAGLNVGSNGIRRWLVYPMIALTVFMILVAGLYHWLRQGEETLISAAPESTTQAANPGIGTLATPAPEGSAPIDEGATITPLALPGAVTPPTAADTSPSSAPATVPDASIAAPATPPVTTTATKPPAPEAIAPSSIAGDGVKSTPRNMRFEPSQDAWIQVVDAKGNRFSRLVRAGTAESFSGEPPFRLVVGEAALVKLTYNGHNIDLTPFIGQKVARLTLE